MKLAWMIKASGIFSLHLFVTHLMNLSFPGKFSGRPI